MNAPQKISWTATEYDHNHKELDWFWALWIVAGAGSIASVIYGNILFALVVLLSALTVATHANKKPSSILFEINHRGIRSGETLYPYENIEFFWIEEEAHRKKILIQSNKLFMPLIIIPMGDTDAESIRELLKEFVSEQKIHEPLSQKIFEYFGF